MGKKTEPTIHDPSPAVMDVHRRPHASQGIKVRDGGESVRNIFTREILRSRCEPSFDWMDHFPVFAVSEW